MSLEYYEYIKRLRWLKSTERGRLENRTFVRCSLASANQAATKSIATIYLEITRAQPASCNSCIFGGERTVFGNRPCTRNCARGIDIESYLSKTLVIARVPIENAANLL